MNSTILLLFSLLTIMTPFSSNRIVSIQKEFSTFSYYDGKKNHSTATIGKDYWLGATSYADFEKAHISFSNEGDTITLDFFPTSTEYLRIRRDLSTFQPELTGFQKEDLFALAKTLQLPTPILQEDHYRIKKRHHYNFVYQEYKSKHYVMIYSITGGRMPEGVIVHKAYEITFTQEFKNKYLTKRKD